MPRRDRDADPTAAPRVVIDDVDKAIIEALQEDGRLPYTQLGAAGRAVGGGGAPAGAAPRRVRRHADRRGHRPDDAGVPAHGHDRPPKVEGDVRAVADGIAAHPRDRLRRDRRRLVRPARWRSSARTTTTCSRLLNDKVRADPGRAQHRDLHLPPALQADLRVGDPMSHDRPRRPDDARPSSRQARATSGCTSRGSARYGARHPAHHRARRGLLRVGRHRPAAARRAVGPVHRAGRSRSPRARRGRARRRRRRSSTSRSGRYAHPPAIELAARLADLAPGDLNRVFFTSGGSEAVESAWKLARQYFRAIGQGQRHKVIAREIAYHGTTLGRARDHRHPRAAHAVRAAHARRGRTSPTPTATATRSATTRRRSCSRSPTRSRSASSSRGPTPSPRCSSSRCRTPAAASSRPRATSTRVREICDRYGVLLVSDEVICAFGRLGDDVRLRALRLPPRHDHVREGPHQRLLAARRGDLSRLPRRAVPRGPTRRSCTASRSAVTR